MYFELFVWIWDDTDPLGLRQTREHVLMW